MGKRRALENSISHAADGEFFAAPDGIGSTDSPGEERTWDDDERAHLEPTVETARYLASQVMRLRREAHQPRLSTAEKQTREGCCCASGATTHQGANGQRGLSSEGRADAARETSRKEEWWRWEALDCLFPPPETVNGVGGMAWTH
ncbi:hypothetical protein TcYC6_0102900 [Trypanosoma cruzi]|nr:hypothetical protein TcYC6_0102900 [Trypanosoma cruzi]